MRGLFEIEKLVFETEFRTEPHALGLANDFLQQLARTDGEGFAAFHEVAEEKGNIVVPWDASICGEVQPDLGVGITGMPAGVTDVVVTDIVAIPAEHDIAKSESFFNGGKELVHMDVFPAQDAVYVGDGHLHFLDPGLLDFFHDLFRCHVHGESPLLLSVRKPRYGTDGWAASINGTV